MERQEFFFRNAALMAERHELDKMYQEILKMNAEQMEKAVKDSIIGSTILDVQYKSIPNRKTMYELTIKTDAPRVMITDKGYIDVSEIKVRVKR